MDVKLLLAGVVTTGFVIGVSFGSESSAPAARDSLGTTSGSPETSVQAPAGRQRAFMFREAFAAGGAARNERSPVRAPAEALSAISATLGRDDSSYHAVRTAGGFRASNGRQDLRIHFGPAGVVVENGLNRLAFHLRAVGYGDALSAVAAAMPGADRNRIEYRRERLTEWYLNGPLGLEQGFTLASPPDRRAEGLLTFELSVSGSLEVSVVTGDGDLILKRRRDPFPALRYGGLTAIDAAGCELPVRIELADGTVLLRVDDAGARYPIVVDPFFNKATLGPPEFAGECCTFGTVAVSGDTIVVGSPGGLTDVEVPAWVFVRPPSGWGSGSPVYAKLTQSDVEGGDRFGAAVAVNGDTVVVGAFGHDGSGIDRGAAYVFLKPAGGWTGTLTENAKLTGSDASDGDLFGSSVAVSGDTVVVGAPGDDLLTVLTGQQIELLADAGSSYVFVKPPGGWAGALGQSAKLIDPIRAAGDHFGTSVAVSDDTAVVGIPGDDRGGNADQGSACVFVKPPGGWAGTLPPSARLTAAGGAAGDGFGFSVATNGEAAFVGAAGDDFFAHVDQGLAYVFVKPVGGWTGTLVNTAILFASDGQAGDHFGRTINVSGDEVLVSHGVTQPNTAYLFAKPVGGWVTMTETDKVVVGDGSLQFFGFSGNTVAAGSDDLNYVQVYVRSLIIPKIASLLKEIFNPGSTIPLKFRIFVGSGQPISDAEAERLAASCGVQILFSGSGGSPGCARYEGGFFRFKLKTQKTLPPGTYELTVKVYAGGELVATDSAEVRARH